MFSNINIADLFERALWTAAQAFLGAFGSISFLDVAEAQAAAVAGLAAAAAALLSLLKNVVKQNVEA